MDNVWKPRGALKSQKPDAGGAVLRNYPMLGIVKDIVDPTRSGRIRVYISALGGDPENEKSWTPVLYMSPFFGATDTSGGNKDYGSFKANPASYGMWASPPDIGTIVICLFVNGDPNFGFYIGSIPDAEAMRMVPAIGANFSDQSEKVIFNNNEATKYGGATRVPVTNMNTNNSGETESSTFLVAPKPVHSFQASIMFQQGILRDPIRGPISSSAQRESPSRVGWGVSTPGRPIYQGGYTDEDIADVATNAKQKEGLKIVSRRGGHSIVMDDGDLIGQDNLVRIRTSQGHQILMSDDGQTLMILHSNGQSYIELGKEGTIDMYSTNSVNIRTQGDLNLHADNDININATKKLNIHADEININSDNKITQKAGNDYIVSTQGKHTHKVNGAMSMASSGQASFASGSTTFINGNVINLNTGSTSVVPADVELIPLIAQTDTLFSKEKGWSPAPGKLLTIVSRAPAHAPWANAGQGVDVKTNLDADAQLPASADPQVTAANENAATTPEYPATTVPAAATVPTVPAASPSVDQNTTSALVSATAANASSSVPEAVKAGAGVVKDAAGAATGVAVGVTGLTANALQNAGCIKPGSADLVDSLVKAGKTLEQAMPSNLFTGQNSSANLTDFVNNASAQATATVANLQQAQALLNKTGLVSGLEGAAATAGPLLSTALNGVGPTVDAIKNVGAELNIATNNLQGSVDGVMKSMASGNFAANLSQNVTGGLAGIANSAKEMAKGIADVIDSAKGPAAAAFESITKSLKSFEANIPQDLKAIAEKNRKENENANNTGTSDPYEGLTEEQLEKLGGADPTDPFIRSRLGLPPLGGTASPSSLASGMSNFPGGSGAIASVVNNATSGTNIVPGIAGVKSLINNVSTATTNNINLDSAINAAKGLASELPNIPTNIDEAINQARNLTAGIPSVGASIDSAVTASTNFLSGVSGEISPASLNSLSSSLTTSLGEASKLLPVALDKLKEGTSSLTSLVSSGLNPGAASQLNAAIASLSAGGPVAIKMPTVALNTTDRKSLTDSLKSVLPAGVPVPNFSGTSASAKSSAEAQQQTKTENAKKIEDLNKQYDEQKKVIDRAEAAYYKAKVDSLPGDPAIQAARDKWDQEVKKQAEISKEIAGLLGINVNVPGLSAIQQQGTQLNASGAKLEKFLRTNPFTGEVGQGNQPPPSDNYQGGG